MSRKHVAGSSDVDENLSALLTNANAVRAIASAVEGTLGSKGLDTMLVDRFGETVITNDGITILNTMQVKHPAARLVINTAQAQEEVVGDGTTTATIMAGALLTEGVNQALKGVPVTQIIAGLIDGVERAIEILKRDTLRVEGLDDPLLGHVALIAGRMRTDIADLVLEAARLVGPDKLRDPAFKLADAVLSQEGADNEVFSGIIVEKEPLNDQMPSELQGQVSILVVDDALEPEEMEEEALATEAGFKKYLKTREEFTDNLYRLVDMGIGMVVVDRGVSDIAEEILTDGGIMVLKRVSSLDLGRLAEHVGARPVKRTALKRSQGDLLKCLGTAETVVHMEQLKQVRVMGGHGKSMATVLVGASTGEVVDERSRIARDAAGAVQAAFQGGVVSGGGTAELAASGELLQSRSELRGMTGYGFDCVIEALKRPFCQIVDNAGFNSLEKMEEVIAAQVQNNSSRLGIDCEDGQIRDMVELGVVDPLPVKTYALRAAGEIAEAILRINTIIRAREEEGPEMTGGATGL